MEQLLEVTAVAKLLSVSSRTIWRYRKLDLIPAALVVGVKSIRWRLSDIERWIALGCPDRKTFEHTA